MYVVAPLAVIVVDWPAQILAEDAVIATVGEVLTFTVNVLDAPTQLPLLPVTVYIVVDVGDNVLVDPEPDGNQVKDVAPVKLATIEVPLQIVVFVIEVTTVGVDVTLTVIVFGALLQVPFFPVTVYVVVVVGVTAITVAV